MAITAFLYTSCSSCRKTEQQLRQSNVAFEKREFFKERLTADEIESLLTKSGLSVNEILSTRSTPYKSMELASRNLSDEELIKLMADEPRLIRRPLVVSDHGVVVGHNTKQLANLIEQEQA